MLLTTRSPRLTTNAASSAPSEGAVTGRRGFLFGIGAAAVVGTVCAPFVSRAEIVLGVNERRIALRHQATGEVFSDLYFAEGEYVPEQLSALNRLLRDIHVDQECVMDRSLIDTLSNLQALIDKPVEFIVTSAYRSPQTNARLRRTEGAAKHSMHLEGKAIDIKVDEVSLGLMTVYTKSLAAGGVGLYRNKDFIHVDTGEVRFWTGKNRRRRA